MKHKLESEGWVCVRAAASLGAVDIWALRPRSNLGKGRVGMEGLACQIKANKGSPWMNFRKAERAELICVAIESGAEPVLIHWPPHGEERWYSHDEWPEISRK